MKYHQKYGKQGNSTTYSSDTTTQYNQNIIDRQTKGRILSFSKEGDFEITKNYWGIILILIAATIYNALRLNRIRPVITKILWKNKNGFRRNRFTISQILTICLIFGVHVKSTRGDNITCRFLQRIWLHTQRKEQILWAYETFAAIMMSELK